MEELTQQQIRKVTQDSMLRDISWCYDNLMEKDIDKEGMDKAIDFLILMLEKLQDRRKFWKEHPV